MVEQTRLPLSTAKDAKTMMPAMHMPANRMMNPMMSMPMPMPVMMCQMTCEMTPEGMVCTMKPMDGMAMDMMKECCDRMNAAMSMGMPTMMMCPNMPMMMCMSMKK